MKTLPKIFFVCLCLFLAVEIGFTNYKKDVVSEMDNRKLQEWRGRRDIDIYLQDRIGFRPEIVTFVQYNYYGKIFHKLNHYLFQYGTDGHVYYRVYCTENYDTVFLDSLCSYIKQVQDYCEARNVSFLYCLNPSKISVYSEYLPKGYVYRNRFFRIFTSLLEKYGVHYIENYTLLKEKHFSEPVFNRQYDAGHWNDLGAFYGTNHMLAELQKVHPKIELLTMDDFERDSIKQEYLSNSKILIKEWVPDYTPKYEQIETHNGDYAGIELHPQHMAFAAMRTEKDSLPEVLFFHGSYYNPRTKFYRDRFYNTTVVHNYENFLNFDYYFNIFQPECVILETAEYSTHPDFFSFEKLKEKKLNKPYREVCAQPHREFPAGEAAGLQVDSISRMLKLSFDIEDGVSFGYLLSKEKEYDLAVDSCGHKASVTLMARNYDAEEAKIALF